MSKVYLILERAYEYNDEIMCSSEGGSPHKVYKDRKEAEREALNLSMQRIRNFDPSDRWGYSFDEMFDFTRVDSKDEPIADKLLAQYKDSYACEMDFKGCSDVELEILARAASPSIFYVQEVEMNS